ncbi:hypothetical protein Har1130_02225 [Haloarcula sp. CBA1130]|uniref:hypothetical protein n=1 Tax=unclassified Haloarcula TaxID=2624677 RepID=UPI00124886E6|nr:MULTISPECIES: hypothetical protein [unclassified Haloarcula]KAA9399921.1 hypothetical protein Har1129_17500 [Haloarcula sp. CBA1129]KAA9401616.1 hypothetical protein Har1130_02225 [Haloarcula sp. CBA1130]
MNRKRKTGEVVVYLLATVAGTLLLRVVAPVIMWANARGYTDDYSWLPGIQSGGGVTSGLAAFVYVVAFAALIGGIALFASGGGSVLDSPSTGADGSGPGVSATPTPTPTPNEAPTLPPVEEATKDTDPNNETQEP